jgi:hypothetical protein
MPRRRPRVDPDVVSPNALVASAARLDLTKKPRGALQQEWQAEAWGFYNECGELRYAANWFGNSLSRATLYAADVGEDGRPSGQPTEHPAALAAAYDLLGGPTTQAQILSQVGVHLYVVGDCYVIGETPVDDAGDPVGEDEWFVASTDELSYSAGAWKLDRGNGKRDLDVSRTVIIRVWTSHPRKKWEADSPTRAVLPILRELRSLVRVAGQQMDSRLAGAGVLILPTNVEFPAPSPDAVAANPGADPLMLSLAESVLVPLDDPTDSARLVPLVLRVPPDAVDKVRHISFASALQAENQTAREACIRRLALGLDMPAEVLLGMSTANHWSAWAIEEQAVKLHIAPKLVVIVDAINEGYYVPALERAGLDPWRYTLWFDVTELVQRPNRGDDAKAAHAAGVLSAAALLREGGFDEGDLPSPEERLERLLQQVIAANPGGAGDLLPVLVHLWQGGKVTDLDLAPVVPPADDGSGEPAPALPAGGDADSDDGGGRALPDMPAALSAMRIRVRATAAAA